MNIQKFSHYQEMTFDSYCKRLVKNEFQNAIRDIRRREKHEIVFSALPDINTMPLTYEDHYNLGRIAFHIAQKTVNISDFLISKVLDELPVNWRNIILLFYFMRQSDSQIAHMLGLTVDAAYYRRRATIQKMKTMMERYRDEI